MSQENIDNYSKLIVSIDNKINEYQHLITQLKQKKNKIELYLLQYFNSNNLDKLKLGNKLEIVRKYENIYTPLSYKFIEEQMNLLFPNNTEKVKQMIQYIKSNRTKTIQENIKIKKI